MALERTLIVLMILAGLEIASCEPEDDLIESLPGLSYKPTFRQFSGYLDALDGKKLHYWFIECDKSPSKSPIVVWMNGGPGCSSLFGLLGENGPFRVSENGTSLYENDFSWNKLANMLYLEAPAGVGFSYSDSKDYNTGDRDTAKNNFAALRNFFNKFPEYKYNDFYLTGESYAGVYIPTLVSLMVDTSIFNLKGFMIGNSLSSFPFNENSKMIFLYNHGLFSHTLWDNLLQTCCPGNCSENCDFYNKKQDPNCGKLVQKGLEGLANLDAYNIYADIGSDKACDPMRYLHTLDGPWPRHLSGSNSVRFERCSLNGGKLAQYLNTPAVRAALHVPKQVDDWRQCTGIPYAIEYEDMQEQYKKAIATKKLRIMLFNGDVDSVCNFLGDEWFVDSLHPEKPQEYKQWYYNPPGKIRQVGGFVKTFERFTFATVRGSGHMVPQDKPIAGFVMFRNYLNHVF